MVGLAMGAVVALGPSCGATSCRQTCNGCCDAVGNCMLVPDNRSSSTCGLKGATCVDCASAGQLCELSTLTCVAASDAGQGFCGCSLPSGACAAGTTEANCGADAGVCMTCDAGLTCSAGGACIAVVSTKQVGASCASSAECRANLGASAECKLQTSSGSGTYVGGYCTLPCSSGAAKCPAGSTCASLEAQYGEPEALCWDNCLLNGGDPCRAPGYRCYGFLDGGAHACWISPLPPVDAGSSTDTVGLPCDAGSDCQSALDGGGVCLSLGVDRHWVGGYCSTAACSLDTECATDGGALCATLGTDGPRCLRRCEVKADGGTADAGQGSCRPGYLCQPALLPDGGPSSGGVCAPGLAPPPARTGAACATLSDCLVPIETVATCFPEARVVDGGTVPTGYLGGLCTRLGCRDDADCAPDAGGVCQWPGAAPSQCFEACELGSSACRPGYVCRSASWPDGGVQPRSFCAPRCEVPGNACLNGQLCDADAGLCR